MNTAEREFREALRCQPDDAETNDNLGNLLFERGVYKEAAFYFERAVDADPMFAEAHHHFGRLLAADEPVAPRGRGVRTRLRGRAPEIFRSTRTWLICLPRPAMKATPRLNITVCSNSSPIIRRHSWVLE